MIKPPNLIIAGIALLVGVLATLTLTGNSGALSASWPGASSGMNEELAELTRTQQDILRRLEGLESSHGHGVSSMNDSGTRFAPLAGNGRRSGPDNGLGGMLTAAQIEARTEEAILKRENAFVSEPLSTAWANSTERLIRQTMDKNTLAKEGAAPPRALDTVCHSQTCRISMSYSDGMQADFAKVVMLQQIAESLPKAEIFEQPKPDGTFSYLIYATTGN